MWDTVERYTSKQSNSKGKVRMQVSCLFRFEPLNSKMDRHGLVDLDELLEKLRERFQISDKLIIEIVENLDENGTTLWKQLK